MAPDPLMELDQVERWRLEELLDAGYPPQVAERIAICHDVDLHQACALVHDQGCEPELAARILL